MAMATVKKRSASGLPMTKIYPMISAQNASTPKATHYDNHAAFKFPSNSTVRHASRKIKGTKMIQKSRTEGEAQNAIFPLH